MRILSSLLFLSMVTATVSAQQRGVIGTTGTKDPSAAQKWAIVIGVGDYVDESIGDLPNAVRDARAVRDMLVTMPDGFPAGNVLLLTDGEGQSREPTRGNIMRYLRSRLGLAGPDDTVLVYFAGHGTTEDGKLFLLPRDAALSDLKFTGFPFEEAKKIIDNSPSKKKIFILDACHSGTGRATETLTREAARDLERASEGFIVLASCKAKQQSHEMPGSGHGAFTYFLLQGMTGEADYDKNGYLSATELSLYTWDKTRRWASEQGFEQTPLRMEKVSGDIFIARTGGKIPGQTAPQQSVEDALANIKIPKAKPGSKDARAETLLNFFDTVQTLLDDPTKKK